MTNAQENVPEITAETFQEILKVTEAVEAIGRTPYPSYYLMNLHEVLSVARMEKDDDEGGDPEAAMIAGSYRIEPELKKLAETICIRNGASLSEFLRGCVRTLVLEYR